MESHRRSSLGYSRVRSRVCSYLSFAGKSFDTAYRFFLERGSRAHWHWHCPLPRPAYLPPSVHEPMRTCRPTSPARCTMALHSIPALPRARLTRWFPKFTGFSKENHRGSSSSPSCLRDDFLILPYQEEFFRRGKILCSRLFKVISRDCLRFWI